MSPCAFSPLQRAGNHPAATLARSDSALASSSGGCRFIPNRVGVDVDVARLTLLDRSTAAAGTACAPAVDSLASPTKVRTHTRGSRKPIPVLEHSLLHAVSSSNRAELSHTSHPAAPTPSYPSLWTAPPSESLPCYPSLGRMTTSASSPAVCCRSASPLPPPSLPPPPLSLAAMWPLPRQPARAAAAAMPRQHPLL